jgi:hypothetical protein
MSVSQPRRWRVRTGTGVALTVFTSALGFGATAQAKPTAPALICQEYEDVPECAGKVVACTLCHDQINPPSWNAFGRAVGAALETGVSFEQSLPDALKAIEEDDSDADGVSNLDELLAGTLPGSASSVTKPSPGIDAGPTATTDGDTSNDGESATNPDFQVGRYDPSFAFKRITTLYCGRSPSFEQRESLRKASEDPAGVRKQLHETLDGCLKSDYWQKTILPRLADPKIRPQGSLGPDSKIMFGGQKLSIADYYYDYRLWRWAMTENRDMRQLLTADYFVLEGPDGKLTTTYDVVRSSGGIGGGQPLPRERRAGMITTQWFLVIHTMFSALPRTTAAQAYRAYLGTDISAGEGLIPVPNEPVDIDKKGVAEARCAGCHSTLDPLAYAFMKYEGIGIGIGGGAIPNIPNIPRLPIAGATPTTPMAQPAAGAAPATGGIYPMPGSTPVTGGIYPTADGTPGAGGVYPSVGGFGNYSENRGPRRIPGWDDAKQQAWLLGKPVRSLIEWAKVASESDQFKRTMTETFYEHAFGREIDPTDLAEFNALWRSLPADGYSANRLLHRLIDTQTFGAP